MKTNAVTQVALANAIGVVPSAIFYWLSGRLPKAGELFRLAKFFNVRMEAFFDDPSAAPSEEERRKSFELDFETQRMRSFLLTHRLTFDHFVQAVFFIERLRSVINLGDAITPEMVASARAAMNEWCGQQQRLSETAELRQLKQKAAGESPAASRKGKKKG